MSGGLTLSEIYRLVNDYIGVSEGYLGDFSYRTHREFYPHYCDLDIDPSEMPGTTRDRFIAILRQAEPHIQVKILEGTLAKYPVGSAPLRTEEKRDEIQSWIDRLNSVPLVPLTHAFTRDTVERAIRDAETLLKTSGATSGVDRIHTALHGYLETVCDTENITYDANANMSALFSALLREHPAFQVAVAPQEIVRVLRSTSAIIDALNPLRNQASLAHPNQNLIEEPEAFLIINVTRSLLNYIEMKRLRHTSL